MTKSVSCSTILLAAILAGGGGCGGDGGGPPAVTPSSRLDAAAGATGGKSAALYDEAAVVDFSLGFSAGEWERLMAAKPGGDKVWVHCSFAFAGERFEDAGCRRKGNGDDWLTEKKPQLIVDFNRWVPKGRFRGLRRVNLEAFDGTAAPVRDRLALWVMRQAGLNAPRANHARVFKDGNLLGVYQNIEAIDEEFLQDQFGADAKGNLWDEGEFLETNQEVADRRALNALDELVQSEPLDGDHSAFFAALEKTVDVHEVLREMAAEAAVVATDNFSTGSTNFYYYEHPTRGFMVLPWDLDQTFTEGPANADPFEYWGPPETGGDPNRMRQLMNRNPAWKQEYVADLVEIRDRVLSETAARGEQICAQIRTAIGQDQNRSASAAEFDEDCNRVRVAVTARIAGLKKALGR